jgi:hypothetical protein
MNVSASNDTDIGRLLAYEEIRQLAAHYAVSIGMLDVAALSTLFVEDVRVPGGESGREAFARVLSTMLAQSRISILNVGTHAIDLLNEDHAEGVVYCHAEMGDEREWLRQLIVYEDRYERRGGRWYFVSRKHRLVYGQVQPRSPLDQPAAEWPKSAVGRGTAPMHWPSWHAFWATHEGNAA